MKILSVGTALPPHYADQATLIAAFEALWAKAHHNPARVRALHAAVQVDGRYLALPLEDYAKLRGFGDANDAWLRVGTDLAEAALTKALAAAGLRPDELDAIWSTTVTGVATPSLEARLFHRMPLRADIRRTPMFGMGCVAGVAGLARIHDYLLAYPDHAVALLSVELCSLTLQRGDLSVANLVASGLFGDGAAAVIAVGAARAAAMGFDGPTVIASGRRLYPDSLRVMGWDVADTGFQVVLDRSVPDVVTRYIREDTDAFLAGHGLRRADIGAWVCHPGGPKVLTAFEDALETPPGALDVTWRSLRAVGNLSSSSVLFVLHDTLADHRPPPGTWGMMLALGPGFCSELLLMRW